MRDLEGATIPSLNIVAWIAKNVKIDVVLEEEKEEDGKFTVVLGGEDEREKVERERLAELQRYVTIIFILHCE